LQQNNVKRVFHVFLELESQLNEVNLLWRCFPKGLSFSNNECLFSTLVSFNLEWLKCNDSLKELVSVINLGLNFGIRVLTKAGWWVISFFHVTLDFGLESFGKPE
jgi:hypothetical protein